jgi:coatomer protein complex subunit gamma
MILNDREPQIEKLLLGYIENCLRNKSDIVTFEAARSLCLLAQIETDHSGSRRLNATTTAVMGIDFAHALTILQIGLSSGKPVNRLAGLRTLNALSRSRPLVVSRCNQDIEPLLSDENRNIATLALTVLLKTAQEANVDKLVRQIGSFMNDLNDMYKLDVVNAVRSLCDSYPSKYKVLLNFLASALREEGSHDVKHAIANAIISIIRLIPNATEAGLVHLCEFIEDCEYPNLCCSILSFLTDCVPGTQNPSKYIRFIYNRLILENATVRAAAVESLTRIGMKCPELRDNVRILLETAATDSDDEVRDKVNWYLSIMSPSSKTTSAGSDIESFLSVPADDDFSIDALYEALEQHVMDPSKVTVAFDISTVPDERTYSNELRTREAAAVAAAAAAAATASTAHAAISDSQKNIASSGSGFSGNFVDPGQPTPEFLAAVSAIMDPSMLGALQHVCKPQPLTEVEAEYTVQALKHVFKDYTVLEFYVTNTVESVILANVHVKLGNVDPSLWKEVGSVPVSTIGFNEGRSAFTVLSRRTPIATSAFPASLHFTQREDGDPVGFPDDFPIEPVRIGMSDYIVSRLLPSSHFPRAWDALGGNGIERVQKYALSYKTLEATVAGLINTLNMAPCEGTDRLEPGVQKPTLFLAGNFLGDVPVLAQAIMYIHPQRGCMIQLTSRGGTEIAAEAVQRALDQ